MLADGDSITANNIYPTDAMTGFRSFLGLKNVAVSGYTSQSIVNHMSGSVTPYLTEHSIDVVKPVYTLMIGVNDWWLDGRSAAAIYANIQSVCSTVVATGARMVLFSPLPANLPIAGGAAGWETVRQALITLELAGGACAYTFENTGNDPTIGQAGQWSNATYYMADGIHPTPAGDAIIAPYMTAALIALGVQ